MQLNSNTGIRERWWPWLLFLTTAAIYLAFLTKNYYWDGIAFAQMIEDAPQLNRSLLHPNHLIYNHVGYIFFRALRGLGFNLRAVTALQILNCLIAALTCTLLFHVLRQTLRSRYLAVALSLLFAFTATWWRFAVDADAYIPGVFLLLLCFYLVLPDRKARPVIVALVYTLALCVHQMAIMFLPTLILAIFIQDQTLKRNRRLVNCFTFTVIAGGLTLGAYVLSFYLLAGHLQVRDFLRWTLSYAPDDSFGFRPLINLGFTLRGHGRLLFGGRFNAISGLVNPVIVVLMVVWVVLCLLWAYKMIRHFRIPNWEWYRALKQDSFRGRVALLAVVWAATYLLAFYCYVAHHTYYRLFYLPALIILIGIVLDAARFVSNTSRHYRLATFVALLAVTNFLTLIYPYAHVQKYPPLAFALELQKVWPRGTVVYYGRADSDNSLIKYFNPGMDWRELDLGKQQQLETELREAQGRGINTWIETTALSTLEKTPTGTEWLEKHKAGSERILMTKGNYIKVVQVVPASP